MLILCHYFAEGLHQGIEVDTIVEAMTGMPMLEMPTERDPKKMGVVFRRRAANDTAGLCLPEFSTCFRNVSLVLPCASMAELEKRMSYALTGSSADHLIDVDVLSVAS